MEKIYVIVPSFNPDEKIMTKFLKELKENFKYILIVNDGSNKKHQNFFDNLKKDYEVISNYQNYGKGRAIKNAFNYLLNKDEELVGVITCDCDGQHTILDIKKIEAGIMENNKSLILGVREFKGKNIPLKSRVGNNITKGVFRVFVGLSISDTQTGLRGFSKQVMQKFLDTPGERYEYETNMLIKCKNERINIQEIPIETVYFDNNQDSHFRPIKDSIRIYKLFIKYILSSLSSFLIDLLLFGIMLFLFKNSPDKIIFATIFARIISSIWNYFINANLVFNKSNYKSIIMYYILVFVQMLLSALSVDYFYYLLNGSIIMIKIIVDFLIFIFNYFMQKNIIFKRGFK